MYSLLRLSIRSSHGALIGMLLLGAVPAGAVPASVTFEDTADCDVLSVPAQVEELGNPASPPFGPTGPFPADEAIASAGVSSFQATPCAFQGVGPNVQITNLTSTAFDNVWYVADPQASFENFDGLVNGAFAVKIDAVGVNTPLIAESVAADGIFAPGETWTFILAQFDDVCGYSVTYLGSIGVATSETDACHSPSEGPPTDGSTGSIIATAVPEPGTLGFVGLGLIALVRRDRRR